MLARADDMVNVRGVNVFPAAIESVVRRFARDRRVPLDREPSERDARAGARNRAAACRGQRAERAGAAGGENTGLTTALAQQLREALGLTIPIQIVPPGTLPQFDMKSRRFVVER